MNSILETIYQFLLHTFALIGLVFMIIVIVVGKIMHSDQIEMEHEDKMLITKTDQELYDSEN